MKMKFESGVFAMISRFWLFGIFALSLGQFAEGQQLKSDELMEQCAAVSQDTNAPWRTIPWQTDLLDAQRLAVETQRPLFIWAMDGHPLGCT
jgi:hypothetical protein